LVDVPHVSSRTFSENVPAFDVARRLSPLADLSALPFSLPRAIPLAAHGSNYLPGIRVGDNGFFLASLSRT
jgi:hypothetical protein